MEDQLRSPFGGNAAEPTFADALRAGGPTQRFPGSLERDYERAELIDHRGLIRTFCTCAAVITLWHTAQQILAGRSGTLLYGSLVIIVTCSLGIAVLAWSPLFERHYRPWANVLIPLRDVVAVSHLVNIASQDSLVILMTLPFMVIAAFFLLGLRTRVAVICTSLCLITFTICGLHDALAAMVVMKGSLFLAVTIIGSAIGRAQLERRARASFLERGLISDMAQRDPLTGTRNRRVFDEYLAQIWHDAAAGHRSLAIILIDVDHFKAYNDRYGHLAGDDTLRRVARAVQTSVRGPRDLVARYGGEEFGVIAFDVTATEIQALAERIRRAVLDLAIEHLGSRTAAIVTISLGAAIVEPTLLRECRGALQLADQALYQAKMRGRNCIEILDDSQYRLLVTGVFSNPHLIDPPAAPRRARRVSA